MENRKEIDGNTLINLGFTPGKWFRDAIVHINEQQLNEGEMMAYLEQYRSAPMIDLHLSLIHI